MRSILFTPTDCGGTVIPDQNFLEKLLDYTGEYGISLDERQASLCQRHIQLMLQWNLQLNLTRITATDQVIIQHVLDSLIPVRWLPEKGYALDVGTGPGFPGIPLKVLNQNLKMVLLEAQRKKVSFLRVALSAMELKDAWAVQGRIEEFGALSGEFASAKYSLITMRAVRMERNHLTHLGRLLRPDGMLAWWAGPRASHSRHAGWGDSPGGLDSEGVVFDAEQTYSLPSISEKRRLFIWKKVS